MPSFEEARKIVLESVSPLGAEVVSILDAIGRDKILTGAPLPPGADAVIPFEEAEERDGKVFPRAQVKAGAHVRRKGEDFRAGERVLGMGTVIGPADISFLATCSKLSVPVFRRARVAILSTGDELVEPGEPLAPGKIHDSNGLAVAAAVKQAGGDPVLLGGKKPVRVSLVRVRLERNGGALHAWSAGNQDTGILRTMVRADGVAIIPAEWGDVRPSTAIDVQVCRGGFELRSA